MAHDPATYDEINARTIDVDFQQIDNATVMARMAAFHAINTERAYQDQQRGNAARHEGFEPGVQHPAETLTYLRKCLRDAEEAVYRGSSGVDDAMPFVRKIAALATFIMEHHGAPVRAGMLKTAPV